MSRGPESVEEAIVVEQLDVDIFRSDRLWKFTSGRGAYGGQIIAQCTNAAGATVQPPLYLHSLSGYFLSFGDVEVPVLYMVERVREGRSYATRIVRAIQRGKPIFVMTASYAKPEPEQPHFQVGMHAPTSEGDIFKNIPQPEDCLPVEDNLENFLRETPDMSEKIRKLFRNTAEERRLSSIEIRFLRPEDSMPIGFSRQTSQQAIWFRSRASVPQDTAFRQCVIAYASDFSFIGTVAKALNLKIASRPRLGMLASLDHTMHFYGDVDPSQWLLFIIETQAAGNGRGIVNGRIYTRDGKLVVIVQQEGVVRQALPATKL